MIKKLYLRERLAATVTLLILFAAGQFLGDLTQAAAGGFYPRAPFAPPSDAIVDAMFSIGEWVMTILIAAAAIGLTVGIATGAVQGLFATAVGSPYALAGSWFKIVSVVILAAIALGSRLIAQQVMGIIPRGGATIPRP
jgi:hypothetical protein